MHYNTYFYFIICMYTLSQGVCSYVPGVHLLIDYPAKGFCLKLSCFKDMRDFVSRAFLIVSFLQASRVAHNVYITRAKLQPDRESYDDVRIYIWARRTSTGIKDTAAFIPAVCELFGHLSIRGRIEKFWINVNCIISAHWNINQNCNIVCF